MEASSGFGWEYGGGIRCEGASPVIEGNLILENKGTGIYCRDGAEPLITGNTIAGNQPNMGAGILCGDSSPVISNNHIHTNVANIVGPNAGGGISCYDSEAVIAGNEITDLRQPYPRLERGWRISLADAGGQLPGLAAG